MEKLALISSKSPVFFAPPKPSNHFNRLQRPFHPPVGLRGSRLISCALRRGGSSPRISNNALETIERHDFASISSSSNSEMYTTSGNQQIPFPPPSSSIGSPLFWVGVGVGLSALFSIVAKKLKEYAMQQAFKTMMSQAAPQNDQFSNLAFSPGSPFPFNATPSPASQMASSAKPLAASRPVDTVDVAATKVETTSLNEVKDETATKEIKKYAFVDVSPDEVLQKDSQYSEGPVEVHSAEEIRSEKEVSPNGASVRQENNASREQPRSSRSSALSVEALEKMMEDPTVQKMVYPYLPEEMRNPTTFKWMLQNPEYRRQLEDMLTNMGGSSEWDSRMVESLKNFDLSSPDVKQQFEQIGLTPEEVISRIMANPEVALAFQNPKVQAAMMDVSQNPLSIAKYQNDKEVMDAFNKISELFPGATGSP